MQYDVCDVVIEVMHNSSLLIIKIKIKGPKSQQSPLF